MKSPPDFEAAGGEKIDPLPEVLALASDTQVMIARLPDRKFKATSKSWDEEKMFLVN